MRYIHFCAMMLLAVTLTACGAQKQVAADTVSNNSKQVGVQNSSENYLDALEQCNAKWQDVKIPIKLKLKSPKDISVSGYLTMSRDKSINISLRMLGFEVGALTLTEDSIIAYEKLNKRYVSEPLTQLLAGFPATVGNVQALLLGKLFMPGSDTAALTAGKNAKIEVKNNGKQTYVLYPQINIKGLTCSFEVLTGSSPTLQSFSGTAGTKPFSCDYSDFLNDNVAGKCATLLTLKATAGDTSIDATIEVNLKKAKWNTGEQPSTKIPKGYQRIPAASLVKMLKQL